MFDLIQHLHRQQTFSEKTFGPGLRTDGIINHIKKELEEIKEQPQDVEEWIDVVILALDGAWRAGYKPEQIVQALEAKQTTNEGRSWPNWQEVASGQAIEHLRD